MTPFFLLLDLLWDYNIRVNFLDDNPALKWGYYALAFACGLVTLCWPTKADWIALLESSCNIGILIVGFWLIYVNTVTDVVSAAYGVNPAIHKLTVQRVINFCLAGGILLISFYGNPIFHQKTNKQGAR